MVQEKVAELVRLRPGRHLFVRHWILGGKDDSLAYASSSSNKTIVNLICVHGTGGSQEQYLPLLRALEQEQTQTNNTLASSSWMIHCWMWDAVGCGKSPKIANNSDAYSDSETVLDIQAIMEEYVDKTLPTYFMGHSYGPQWIYKYLQLQQDMKVAGLILLSTGMLGDGLVNQGPLIFRILPLSILNCLQPIMTKQFLKMAFSPHTHETQPELIEQALNSNDDNDMQVICYYHKHSEWLSEIPSSLKSSFTPALILHGVDDDLLPIHQGQRVANQFQQQTDSTTTINRLIPIQNASHMIMLEQPNEVAQHILSFLMETIK